MWLNNDTIVQPGWLEALVATAEQQPRVGAVGAQLRYPDGRLQEVGGIVWRDGSAARVGDGQWPTVPLISRPRDVDYCSAAALLVRRNTWFKLGGFDTRYAPAYYEDSDLCLQIRAAGQRVVVQPKALVMHFDGMSHGRDVRAGVKAYQLRNQTTLAERWRPVLERDHQPPGENLQWAMDRARSRPMVLVADHKLPEPDRDAGSRSIMHLMRAMIRAGALVAFWPHNQALPEPYRQQLEAEGILLLADVASAVELASWVRQQSAVLNWMLLSRPDVAEAVQATLGARPGVRLAYYGHDLHHRRLERQADYHQDKELAQQARAEHQREQQIWRKSELIFYSAAEEVDEVEPWAKTVETATRVRQLPVYGYQQQNLPRFAKSHSKQKRPRLLFVAGFSHPPNTASAEWFLNSIWSSIHEQSNPAELWMVGSNPPSSVRSLVNAWLESGSVHAAWNASGQELEHYYTLAQIAIAPIVYGAGVNGKIVEALRHGLPCVTTTQGIRGFGVNHGSIIEASNADTFVKACLSLLNDQEEWLQQSRLALATVQNHFSEERLLKALDPLLRRS